MFSGVAGTFVFFECVVTGSETELWESISQGWRLSQALSLAGLCLFSVVWFSVYATSLVLGVGLWRLKSWGRLGAEWLFRVYIAIVFVGAMAFHSDIAIAAAVLLLTLCVAGPILWYLRSPGVRLAFGDAVSVSLDPQPSSALNPKTHRRRMIATGFAGFVIFVVLMNYGVKRVMRSSEVYRLAVDSARKSPAAIAELGPPIEDKGSLTGSIDTRSAELRIQLYGSIGSGHLDVSATGDEGHWSFQTLDLETVHGKIDLLDAAHAQAQ